MAVQFSLRMAIQVTLSMTVKEALQIVFWWHYLWQFNGDSSDSIYDRSIFTSYGDSSGSIYVISRGSTDTI